MSALSTAVLPEQLPKTFTDAIEFARELHIDYIWIDSLCIVQDDEDDWRRETKLMEHVYGGSYLNIAASSATSVHEGCWMKPAGRRSGMRAKVTIGTEQLVREIRDRNSYDTAVWESHLATRAWALQEKLLPPRTVHLGDRGAFWECRTTIANEFLPGGFTQALGSGLLKQMNRMEFLQSWWAQVVRLFTGANLTYARDKLPALSGVARRVHSQKGGQYLAGLWRDERIEAQLCWSVIIPEARPNIVRAPSWSWASIDGKVVYQPTQEGICDDNYGHVSEATVSPLGDDPFAEVSGGMLRLSCSGMLRGCVMDRKTIAVQSGQEKARLPISLDSLDDSDISGETDTYLLPLIGGRAGFASRQNGEYTEAMVVKGILLRSSGGATGEFRRIGAFKCGDSPGSEFKVDNSQYHQFVQIFEKHGKGVAESVCEGIVEIEVRPDERYVVTVV